MTVDIRRTEIFISKLLYDRDGELASFLERVRKLIELAGLERYKTGNMVGSPNMVL